MKCIKCKTKEREGKNDICSSCRLKKWRKDNPDKIKAYLERTKEHREKAREEYAKNNSALYTQTVYLKQGEDDTYTGTSVLERRWDNWAFIVGRNLGL